MPFCFSPWTNIDISPTGDISPCCKFQTQYYDEKFNIQTTSVSEYKQSKLVTKIKNEFLEGNWPKGCERCQIDEDNNIKSKRELDFNRWGDKYNAYNLCNDKFITASIAFGNTCNLKCITCNPYSSSKWQQEYTDIYGVVVPPVKFYKHNFVSEFTKEAPEILHIDIPGGEPFLSGVDEQQQLLSHYIRTNRAKNISLHYTTNGTIYPDANWQELWQHFQEVDLQLSIDGVGDRYEYIRYPAKWDKLVNNVCKYLEHKKQQNNFRLSVSHTVSAYNIFYLNEFFDWCSDIGLPKPWLGKVHTPSHMRPSVWNSDARSFISTKLKSSLHSDVVLWGQLIEKSDDSEFFELFKQRLHQHDTYRGISFYKTFPELELYV